MNDYAIRFRRIGAAKYISHLDQVRLFERAIKRAGFRCAFSEGFHPHALIKFLRAVPVGTSSDAEMMVVTLKERPDGKEFLDGLCCSLPEGFEPTDLFMLKARAKRIGVNKAHYEIKMEVGGGIDPAGIDSALQEFLTGTLTKKTKKGEKEVKISDYVEDARILPGPSSLLPPPSSLSLELTIRFINGETLKPELICQELISRYDLPLEISSIHCTNLVPK